MDNCCCIPAMKKLENYQEKYGNEIEFITVSTDTKKNLNKYVTFKLTADVSVLTENERKMLPILINAANKMNELFWYESYGDKKQLLDSITDEETKQFVEINYGPWDRLNNNASFVEGIGEKPKGANYYPADMSKAEFDKFKDTSKSSLYTFVRRNSDGSLKTIPYHIQFASKNEDSEVISIKNLSYDKLFDNILLKTINKTMFKDNLKSILGLHDEINLLRKIRHPNVL